jgi:hypothetical protein
MRAARIEMKALDHAMRLHAPERRQRQLAQHRQQAARALVRFVCLPDARSACRLHTWWSSPVPQLVRDGPRWVAGGLDDYIHRSTMPVHIDESGRCDGCGERTPPAWALHVSLPGTAPGTAPGSYAISYAHPACVSEFLEDCDGTQRRFEAQDSIWAAALALRRVRACEPHLPVKAALSALATPGPHQVAGAALAGCACCDGCSGGIAVTDRAFYFTDERLSLGSYAVVVTHLTCFVTFGHRCFEVAERLGSCYLALRAGCTDAGSPLCRLPPDVFRRLWYRHCVPVLLSV